MNLHLEPVSKSITDIKIISQIYTLEGIENYIENGREINKDDFCLGPREIETFGKIIHDLQQEYLINGVSESFEVFTSGMFNNYVVYRNDIGMYLLNFHLSDLMSGFHWYYVMKKHS